MRFLFEAPPPYEEADVATPTSSDERRRMVSMKLPELLLHKAADTRLIEMLRSKHTSSGKAAPLNPSTSEAEGPSTISTSRLKHVNNAISSTPAISTTQRSLSGSTTPTSSPHTQGTSLVKTNSMVTNISTVSSVITKESQQRENAGRSSAEKVLKMEKCQHRATSNLSQNIDICKNHDSKRPTVAAVVKRSDDPRNADDVPTRNS
uniref:Uncharacterized protein n=1 Tax=Angiostrongylus cantonensis TaxID=6313 RepID=A0A0K0DH50_ANGCA